MKKQLTPFLLFFFFISCDEETLDCSTVLCIGPPALTFEVLQNNTNVFENGIYTLQDVFLSGENTENFELQLLEREFSAENGETEIKTILFLTNDDWQIQRYTFNLNFSTDFSLPITTEIGLSEGECCGGIPRITALELNQVSQEIPLRTITLVLD